MKVAAIIQARMGSTRLPGKILKKVLGKPLLEYQIERVKMAKCIDQIIIATTMKESDNPIIQFCQKLGIPYYRGSEEDVLSRYYEAAIQYNVDVVVRLTSDCPIIDPRVVDRVIHLYLSSEYDYVSNTLERSFPRGMDAEVFSLKVLKEAYQEGIEDFEREHVTPFIYRNPQRYRLGNLSYSVDKSEHRWTVDTVEDFELIKRIIESLYLKNKVFNLEDALDLVLKKPHWSLINKHVEQKKI